MPSAISLGKALRPKVPTANNGGTTYPGKPKVPTAATTALTTPPAFTFDPALAAKQREATLKEEQNLEDINRQQHFNATDFRTALQGLKTTERRKKQQFGMEERRGNEKLDRESRHGNEKLDRERASGEESLGNEEADTRKNASRQFEDFATKRKEIGRQFGELAQRQAEAQNAGGTLDQGTSAAAAAARARNQQLSEAPIATSETRLGEDLATALGRISTARGKLGQETDRQRGLLGEETTRERGELAEDLGIARRQTGQDLRTQRKQAGREYGRQTKGLETEEQRTKLAGVNARQNYLEEEIYQAMEEHPAEFKKWAEENPDLLPEGVTPKGVAKPGEAANAIGLGQPVGGERSTNGGTAYPGKNKKRRR